MAAKKYKIKVQLYDNPLTANPNDLVARTQSERALSVEEICEKAAKRGETQGSSGFRAKEMAAAVNHFLKEAASQLCNGYIVTTDLFTAVPKIKGSFNSQNERFNPTKHRLLFYFHQGSMLCEEAKKVEIDVTGMADIAAYIAQVTDVKTGSINDIITPQHALRITGNRMRITGENRQNGIYFTNEVSGSRTKIENTNIVNNNPSELIIITPKLSAGKYKIEIVTQYTTAQYAMKEPKKAVFDKALTVT
jgi:hypothetical protein